MILAAKATVASSTLLPYQWVAVGDSGNLWTSTSTTAASGTWTSRTSSFGTDSITAVASSRSLWVAVGASGKLATSPDGITWTQRTSSFGATNISNVAFGNGIWVAVGDAGKIATSTDAITWTQRTSGTADALQGLAYGNGTWFTHKSALANGLSATDPTGTWTARTTTCIATGSKSVAYDPTDAIWVAGCDSGASNQFASSPDAITWTARNSSFTPGGLQCQFAASPTVWVNASTTGILPSVFDVQSSTDGITWTNRAPSSSTGLPQGIATDTNDLFAILLETSRIETTTDGTTYTNRGTITTGITFRAIAHSSGVRGL